MLHDDDLKDFTGIVDEEEPEDEDLDEETEDDEVKEDEEEETY